MTTSIILAQSPEAYGRRPMAASTGNPFSTSRKMRRRRRIFLLVENGFPVEAAIGLLPYASGDCAKIIDVVMADYARHRDHTPATKWTNQSILQTLPRSLTLFFVFLNVTGRFTRSRCLVLFGRLRLAGIGGLRRWVFLPGY